MATATCGAWWRIAGSFIKHWSRPLPPVVGIAEVWLERAKTRRRKRGGGENKGRRKRGGEGRKGGRGKEKGRREGKGREGEEEEEGKGRRQRCLCSTIISFGSVIISCSTNRQMVCSRMEVPHSSMGQGCQK